MNDNEGKLEVELHTMDTTMDELPSNSKGNSEKEKERNKHLAVDVQEYSGDDDELPSNSKVNSEKKKERTVDDGKKKEMFLRKRDGK